jgi:hypothetical protein
MQLTIKNVKENFQILQLILLEDFSQYLKKTIFTYRKLRNSAIVTEFFCSMIIQFVTTLYLYIREKYVLEWMDI